ncbi:MAG: hypothetical protein J5985_00730 [Kiritimatiellae bacterium]|nr:hypothetical protein [Kiritimatiellia bacterium]
MVTLKRLPGLEAFSRIAENETPERFLIPNTVTCAFEAAIRDFASHWRGLAPIDCFVIMPDHLHLLLKIEDIGDALPLGSYVHQLMRTLAREYWGRVPGQGPAHKTQPPGQGPAHKTPSLVGAALSAPVLAPVFEHDWHDWIVKKKGQLEAFTRYIRENPERAWLRKRNRCYFGRVSKVTFLGREWFAYGNTALLELPVLAAFKCSRRWERGGGEWRDALARAERIGPGGAGVSTFMSPCEKECGNAVFASGGALIVLSPEGFGERWHPPREKERICAAGRMLFLSLWPEMDRLPDKKELYLRCHEMGALAAAGIEDFLSL